MFHTRAIRLTTLLCFALFASAFATEDFSRIDQHAFAAPRSVEASFQTLVDYLIEPATNDIQKARAIYAWVAKNISYDVQGYFSGSYRSCAPEDVLRSKTSVCAGYSGIFKQLCDLAGVECVEISGYAKGYSFSTTGRVSSSPDHAWNAIKIDGEWKLIETTWGAGYLNGRSFNRRYTDYYFCTPPEEFIYKHFPEDPEWQLLDSPITLEQYKTLFVPDETYFELGFTPFSTSHTNRVITTGGELTITLEGDSDAALLVNLYQNRRELPGKTFVQQDNGRFTLSVLLPQNGAYEVQIFGKRKSDSGSYPQMISYVVNAQNVTPAIRMGFPTTYGIFGNSGAVLYAPMSGYLKRNTQETFRVKIPGVQKVAVIMGKDWNYLSPVEGETDVYEGTFLVSGSEAYVAADANGSGSFSYFLKYTTY